MRVYVQVIAFACKIYGGLRARNHSSIQTTVLSFESKYGRGLSAAGEKLHSGVCAGDSFCIQFLRRRKVRVHSSMQTTVLSFESNYGCGPLVRRKFCMQKLSPAHTPARQFLSGGGKSESKVRFKRQYYYIVD